MKKKALFLAAAGLAVVSAGLSSQATYARAGFYAFESEDDAKIGHALVEQASMYDSDNASITMSIGMDHDIEGIIYDGPYVDEIDLFCSNGDPLEGVTDYSFFNKMGALTKLTDLRLCGAENVDWDELAKLSSLNALSIDGLEWSASEDEYRSIVESSPKIDISGIEKLSGLNTLYLHSLPLYDLQTIPQLPALKRLYVDYSAIQDITPISNMKTLEKLSFWGNNIQDMDPLLDFCMNVGDCTEKTWEQLFDTYAYSFYEPILENEVDMDVSSLNVELPEYLVAYIKYTQAFNEGRIGNDDIYTIEQKGLELSADNKSVSLDPSASEHIITIQRYYRTQYDPVKIYTIRYHYEPSDNPETLDHSMLGWAMGLAAAIIAGASVTFFVKSRR
jgi:hypothetical protein